MTLRGWLYHHGVRYHAQNLTRDDGGPERAIWRAGRAWVTLFAPANVARDVDGDVLTINPEWHVRLQPRAALGLTVGGGDPEMRYTADGRPFVAVWRDERPVAREERES